MTLSGGAAPWGHAPCAAATRKNLRGDDQFGHPFPPYLVKGEEHLHRSRWRGACRHNQTINPVNPVY
jgi:hypothetical protein